MKSWVCCAITLACVSVGSAVFACPVGSGEDFVRPLPRPVVQNVSFQASEMIERAGRLEAAATSRERQARALEQEADTLSNRARLLRNQAGLVNVSDRSSILAIADELTSRARTDRARAAEDRMQASELRIEAQTLRQRALALVRANGGGGGWRGQLKAAPPRATVLPSERGITL